MVKFRNLLVHLYWKVDQEQLYQILQTNLGDFDLFNEQVRKYLGKNYENSFKNCQWRSMM